MPACILINIIIPPSISSKSTCFTPGEKNNPRLVSPTSSGAAKGLNPSTPHPNSLPPFSLGAVDRVQCSLLRGCLWHQEVAAWNMEGWVGAGYLSSTGPRTHAALEAFQPSEQCYVVELSILTLTEGGLQFGEVQQLLRSHYWASECRPGPWIPPNVFLSHVPWTLWQQPGEGLAWSASLSRRDGGGRVFPHCLSSLSLMYHSHALGTLPRLLDLTVLSQVINVVF